MSLLWRDQVNIALSPERVALAHLGRGLQPRVVARHEFACDLQATGGAPWAKAMETLEAGLGKLEGEGMNATVVLSNHFVRYALVPWSDEISGVDEDQAYTLHCFAQIYGDAASRWALRKSAGGYGETQVASAIDHDLLQGIERIVLARGLRLVSLQPYLMTAFNRWRHQLPDAAAWFVVVEPGRLCALRPGARGWRSLRAVKGGADWPDALKNLLEREFLVSESGGERGTVCVYAPGSAAAVELPGWEVRRLAAEPGAVPDIEFQFETTVRE